MTEARYELIGFRPEMTPAEINDGLTMTIGGMGNDDPTFDGATVREFDIQYALNGAVARHLGVGDSVTADECVTRGAQTAVDLFFGDWWKTNNFYDSREQVDEEFTMYFRGFSKGLLLIMLANRWEDALRLASWINDDHLEGCHGVETEVVAVYFVIAEQLRGTSFNDSAAIRQRAETCRAKRPRLLLALWDAAVSGDQAVFDKAMKVSLQHFAKSVRKKGIGFDFTGLIAQPESVICLWAMHEGLKFPNLPEKLAAYLITRQSLGLED